jgi:hypothetical protein
MRGLAGGALDPMPRLSSLSTHPVKGAEIQTDPLPVNYLYLCERHAVLIGQLPIPPTTIKSIAFRKRARWDPFRIRAHQAGLRYPAKRRHLG